MISIDPGVNGCGVAEWHNGTLVRARYITRVRETFLDKPFAMAFALRKAIDPRGPIVSERPQIYTSRKTDPNDLLTLVEVVSLFCGMLDTQPKWVLPHAWKGNIDPEVCVARIKEKLSAEECGNVERPVQSLEHNVWDAVGIGLHELGRFGKKRITHR